MHKTTVLFKEEARLLKVRTDWAHTPVSMLGKIFSTLRLPAKSANDFSDRSAATNVKSGATWPMAGKLPFVEIGEPWKVT